MAEITLARAEKAINLKYQLWKSQIFEWEEKQVCQKRLREIKIGRKQIVFEMDRFSANHYRVFTKNCMPWVLMI